MRYRHPVGNAVGPLVGVTSDSDDMQYRWCRKNALRVGLIAREADVVPPMRTLAAQYPRYGYRTIRILERQDHTMPRARLSEQTTSCRFETWGLNGWTT